MKKILVILYYWPPSGGAGVQRGVYFVKYLRSFGWEPVVYTPENPDFDIKDQTLLKKVAPDITVLKKPIWEPYSIYRKLLGKKAGNVNTGFISGTKDQGLLKRLSVWIRGNFFIPDPRKFWVRPSVKYLSNYITEHKIETIFTSGPPHSMHLIGLGLKKKHPHLKWVSDFRDPWTNIDFYKELMLSNFADKRHHKLEKDVLQSADAITVVGGSMKAEFEAKTKRPVYLIPNGFDEEDVQLDDVEMDQHFTISHIGTLNSARNPKNLWKVLGELCRKDEGIKNALQIQLIGKVEDSVFHAIKEAGLEEQLKHISYLPHHEAIRKQQGSQVLLLLINDSPNAKGILTGKFFEYLAARRPILGIGPEDGDAAGLLTETGAGAMANYSDEEKMKSIVKQFYSHYLSGNLTVKPSEVSRFSRRALTEKLSQVLNQL